jgi:hypothetical protein
MGGRSERLESKLEIVVDLSIKTLLSWIISTVTLKKNISPNQYKSYAYCIQSKRDKYFIYILLTDL